MTIRKLPQIDKKYRKIIKASMDGFWIVDKFGNFLDVNYSACKMIGYTRKEILSMKISDIEVIEDKKEVVRHLQYMKKHGSDRFETKHRRKDGKIIDVEISTKYLTSKSGDINFVFVRDITDKKRQEIALVESEEKHRSLIEAAKDFIYAIDIKGVIISINKSAARFLHLKKDEAIGKTIFDVFPNYIAQNYYKSIKKVIKTKKPMSEISLSESGGVKKWLDASVSPVIINREVKYIIGISKDVTREKEAENKIKKINQELKKIDELRSVILRDVTHELKSPSAIIKMTSAVLLDEFKKHDIDKIKILDYLEVLSRNAVRFNDQVDSMIKLSRYENLKNIRKQKINLHDIFYTICKKYFITAGEKNIKFNCLIDKQIFIHVNNDLFVRAVKHLVDNAVKYTKRGHITIKAQTDKKYITIQVIDTGIGISGEHIKKIFKPFTKVDPSTEGLGLGLATTKKIIELHGGTIQAKSILGKGTIFEIKLPI